MTSDAPTSDGGGESSGAGVGGGDAVDGDELAAAAGADEDGEVDPAHAQGAGEEAEELVVGRAVGGRGGEGHVEVALAHADDHRA